MKKILISIPLFIAIGSILLNLMFVALFTWSYNALTKETEIANIHFIKSNIDNNTFTAYIVNSKNIAIGNYEIYGNQWRIDAKFMKMKYWANIIGLDSRYALERFEGRYKNIEEQNSKRKFAYNLGEEVIIDSFTIFDWNPFIDTEYGSSTYKNIDVNRKYTVFKTQTGIIVRDEELL